MKISVDANDTDRRECSGWNEILAHLETFPAPETVMEYDEDVASIGVASTAWVFRGLRSSHYGLQPAIEREAESKSMSWAGLEVLMLNEFKARAPLHLSAQLMPRDELTWLAFMQHHEIPTRLLDFTYSPFVALYFAVRQGDAKDRSAPAHFRVRAIDSLAVNRRFLQVAYEAASEEKKRKGIPPSFASLHLDDFATDRDEISTQIEGLRTIIQESLSADGTRRTVLNRQGCVCAISPPEFNPRLASQQGVFLLNCAEELTFEESLTRMMTGQTGWLKTFDIPNSAAVNIEERLFQMNIHEQSLFPDMQGLAGLIRQKARLHWK